MALVWLAVAMLLLAVNWQRIVEWHYPDPDDILRVVQVRDLLAGQPWFDLHQYRINPGDSPVMHWSRLVDVPLIVLISLLTPLLGETLAEQVTWILVPLLTLGAIMAVVGRMAYRLFGRGSVVFACLACGLAPLFLLQIQPLRIDHHGWQICMLVFAAAALLSHKPWPASALAGAAMATGLSISIELLPLAAAVAGVLLVRWLRDNKRRWWLAGYLVSLAAGLTVFFALTHGVADRNQYCDAVSPAHLAFFAIVAFSSVAVAWRQGLPNIAVVVLLACAGMLGVAVFLWLAPNCLAGPFGNLDPLVRQYWYLNIYEGLPLWMQPADRALSVAPQGVVALAICIHLWRSSAGPRREWWLEYGLLLGAALLAGVMVFRSMAFVGALSALPNGWLIDRAIRRYRAGATPARRMAIAAVAICLLLPAAPVQLVKRLTSESDSSAAVTSLNLSSCNLRESVRLLNRLDRATIFAPIDIGPAILEGTAHSVVATGHHRGQLAMKDVILAYTGTDAAAQAIVSRHGARYLVVCTNVFEPRIYAAEAPDGLMAHLLENRVPAWLQEVPIGAQTTFKVWRVVD